MFSLPPVSPMAQHCLSLLDDLHVPVVLCELEVDDFDGQTGGDELHRHAVIGEGAVIGSNVFITSSVPKGTKVSIKNPDLQFLEPGKKSSPVTELEQEGFRRWKE